MSFFKSVGKFFKNLVKDPIKTLVTLVQAVIIGVAIVTSAIIPGLQPLTAVLIAVAVALFAVGTENKALLAMLAVGSLFASFYLMGYDWSALLTQLGAPAWAISAAATFMAFMANNWWAPFVFMAASVFTTLASLSAAESGGTFAGALGDILGDVTGGIFEVVDGIVGGVVDGIGAVTGSVLGAVLSSPWLWAGCGVFALYLATRDDTQPQPVVIGSAQ